MKKSEGFRAAESIRRSFEIVDEPDILHACLILKTGNAEYPVEVGELHHAIEHGASDDEHAHRCRRPAHHRTGRRRPFAEGHAVHALGTHEAPFHEVGSARVGLPGRRAGGAHVAHGHEGVGAGWRRGRAGRHDGRFLVDRAAVLRRCYAQRAERIAYA